MADPGAPSVVHESAARRAGFATRLRASGATPAEVITITVLTVLVLWLVLYPVGWLIWGAFHSGPPGAAQSWLCRARVGALRMIRPAQPWAKRALSSRGAACSGF